MANLLVHNGTVISLDGQRSIADGVSVAVADDRIVEIGPSDALRRRYDGADVLDASGKAILPGMVDLHGRLGCALLNATGERFDAFRRRCLMEFACAHIGSVEWWRVEARLIALQYLKHGTTTLFTTIGGNGTRTDDPAFVEAVADEFEQVGLRVRIGLSPARPPWPRPFSYWNGEERSERLVDFDDVIDTCDRVLSQAAKRPRRLVDFCVALSRLGNRNPHDPMWTPEREVWVRRQADAMLGLMRKHDVGFWTHCYGNSIEYTADEQLGLLGPRTILSHCTGISPRSIDILRETGTHVAHSPRAARIYSFPGRCPLPEMIDAGINVALGSDAPSPDRPADIFLDMKAAMRQQRIHFKDPNVIPPGVALEMATLNGARALGLNADLGSVEVGKKADLITVDLRQAHLTPAIMPVHRTVYEAVGRDVTDVIVDGRVVMRNHKVETVDEAEVLRTADETFRRMIDDAGLTPFTDTPARFWGVSR